jgi:acyl carrier protein
MMNLNNDMLNKLIVENLSFRDTVNLCSTNSTLEERCQRLNIYDKILLRDYPLATLTNYPAIEQLKLIERGFETVYYYENYETVYFADESVSFKIPGLPPAKGTKVYIVGTVSNYNRQPKYNCFISKQEAIKDIKNFLSLNRNIVYNRNRVYNRNENMNEYDMFFNIFFEEMSDELYSIENYTDFIQNNPDSVDIIQKYSYYFDIETEDDEYIINNLNTVDKIVNYMKENENENEITSGIRDILHEKYPSLYMDLALKYIENNDYYGHEIVFDEVILP